MYKPVIILFHVQQRVVSTRARKFTARRQRVTDASHVTNFQQKHASVVQRGHPPYSQDPSPCDYAIFGPLKKAQRGQTIHLGRRRQAVRSELVNNAAIHRLVSQWDKCLNSHHTAIILLIYRYRFLFLCLRLVSFLMPLIDLVAPEKYITDHCLPIPKYSIYCNIIICTIFDTKDMRQPEIYNCEKILAYAR